MRDPVPLALVALVLLAGCAAPAAPGGSAVDDPVAPDVPVSKNATFDRVAALMQVDGARPAVRVRNLTRQVGGGAPTKFQLLMGVTETAPGVADAGRYYPAEARAVLNSRLDSPRTVEVTLAHEYVHALQVQTGTLPGESPLERANTTDARLASRALIEGGAVWVTDRYVEAHLPEGPLHSSRLTEAYREGPALTRYVHAPYRFGTRYVDGRIDSPANLSVAYENPPTTTEQIVHGYGPDEEQPAELTVSVETGVAADVGRRDVQGELATRVVLRSELSAERARAAAEGWGADRLREFSLARPDATYGVAWALRWDTPADADEFAAAFERYAAGRRDDTTSEYRLARVADETVVVFAGPPAFVERARADGTASSVRVTVGDSGR